MKHHAKMKMYRPTMQCNSKTSCHMFKRKMSASGPISYLNISITSSLISDRSFDQWLSASHTVRHLRIEYENVWTNNAVL